MKTNRREFIRTSLTGSLLAGFGLLSLAQEGCGREKIRWGLHSGSIREMFDQDWKAALEFAADTGFTKLEPRARFGSSYSEFLDYCKSVGIRCVSSGASMSQLLEDPDQYIEEALALEEDCVVAYWPWMSSAENLTVKECMETVDNLNAMGRKCMENGLRFAFHNHDKEFLPIREDGRLPFDILMEETEPGLVGSELDLFWVVRGNADPVKVMEKYPGRIYLIHIKDMADTAERETICIGRGTMDFQTMLHTAVDTTVDHFIVELGRVNQPAECLRESYNYLSTLPLQI